MLLGFNCLETKIGPWEALRSIKQSNLIYWHVTCPKKIASCLAKEGETMDIIKQYYQIELSIVNFPPPP